MSRDLHFRASRDILCFLLGREAKDPYIDCVFAFSHNVTIARV